MQKWEGFIGGLRGGGRVPPPRIRTSPRQTPVWPRSRGPLCGGGSHPASALPYSALARLPPGAGHLLVGALPLAAGRGMGGRSGGTGLRRPETTPLIHDWQAKRVDPTASPPIRVSGHSGTWAAGRRGWGGGSRRIARATSLAAPRGKAIHAIVEREARSRRARIALASPSTGSGGSARSMAHTEPGHKPGKLIESRSPATAVAETVLSQVAFEGTSPRPRHEGPERRHPDVGA